MRATFQFPVTIFATVVAAGVMVGCEEPLRPMRDISTLPRIIEENYKTQPHYRAFVLGYMRRRDEYRSGMATGRSTVEGAIDAAITGCEEGLEGHAPKEVCGIYYIGDIYVPGMTQEQFDKAIELYKINPSATNDNLKNMSK